MTSTGPVPVAVAGPVERQGATKDSGPDIRRWIVGAGATIYVAGVLLAFGVYAARGFIVKDDPAPYCGAEATKVEGEVSLTLVETDSPLFPFGVECTYKMGTRESVVFHDFGTGGWLGGIGAIVVGSGAMIVSQAAARRSALAMSPSA